MEERRLKIQELVRQKEIGAEVGELKRVLKVRQLLFIFGRNLGRNGNLGRSGNEAIMGIWVVIRILS
jgi:hypothetical protein